MSTCSSMNEASLDIETAPDTPPPHNGAAPVSSRTIPKEGIPAQPKDAA